MTTLTVNVPTDKDLAAIQKFLKGFDLDYIVDKVNEYAFSAEEIAGFLKTRQNFIDGKTTARDWKDIEEDLNRAYD